jgi:hypothetical protein
MFSDLSATYTEGLFTDGAERISKSRKDNYNIAAPPFTKLNFSIARFLPKEIFAHLNNGIHEYLTPARDVQTASPELRVLNICTSDWANYMHDNCKSLQAAGITCHGLKLIPHSFNYENALPVVTESEMMKEVVSGKYNVLQVFNSDATLMRFLTIFKGKKIVYHTGSGYRSKWTQLNQVFNPVVDKAIIALGEFAPLGAKKYSYVSVAVDVPRPAIDKTETLKFLHCPSNPVVKGTATIDRLMKSIPADYTSDIKILSHPENVKRMKGCDVYIELLNPAINGNKYGSFGTTAAEAAMLGKIVVTQNLSPEVYEQNYGDCPLILVKNESDFVEKINHLLSLPQKEIFKMKREHQQWAISKHSYLATGLRIKKILNEL